MQNFWQGKKNVENNKSYSAIRYQAANLVKGIHLEGLRVFGNPEDFARYYYENGADELIYIDVVASLYERNSLHEIITKTAREIFIPLTVGGGLRTIEDIRFAWESFLKKGSPFQISCFEYGFMNPWWAFKMKKGGRGEFIFEEAVQKRSQDLEKLYCPTGAIWLAHYDNLINANTFYGPEHVFSPMSWMSGLDIDNHDDLEMGKALARFINK